MGPRERPAQPRLTPLVIMPHFADSTPPPRARASDSGDIAARHWQGGAIDCAGCPHRELAAQGDCQPGRSCMQDAYARRIDRFFRSHPHLAAEHLQHPYFEVRAIAARHADLFRLPALMNDPDETVRLQLALRVPQRLLAQMRADPHREVRMRVAQRLAEIELPTMLRDADDEVRKVVARRLPEHLLALLVRDPDRQVRCEVARRIGMPGLWTLSGDSQPEVRRIVADRLPGALLEPLGSDPDWLVRWTVAARAAGALLTRLLNDEEADVRARAALRWAELNAPDGSAQTEPAGPTEITSARTQARHG